MTIYIDNFLLLLLFLLFLKHLYLFFIFFIMSVNEWICKLYEKITI